MTRVAIGTTSGPRFGRRSVSRLTWGALAALSSSAVGYLLEWIRQRGGCEHGDPSPDTLVTSIYLILIGGGLGGLIVVGLGVRALARRHDRTDIAPMLVAIVALVMIEPLFLSADSGPGGWFQYCG